MEGDLCSEIINNREYRCETLRKPILRWGISGCSKEDFKRLNGVTTEETAELKILLFQRMPVQRLCDVHAAVLGGSVKQIHDLKKPVEEEGHPIYVLKAENRGIEDL